jgi:hypothetical protein
MQSDPSLFVHGVVGIWKLHNEWYHQHVQERLDVRFGFFFLQQHRQTTKVVVGRRRRGGGGGGVVGGFHTSTFTSVRGQHPFHLFDLFGDTLDLSFAHSQPMFQFFNAASSGIGQLQQPCIVVPGTKKTKKTFNIKMSSTFHAATL